MEGIGATLSAAVMITPAAVLSDPVPVIVCLTLANFLISLSSAPTWAVSMDIAGRYAGTVSAVMNMIGRFAGSLSAIVFGALTQHGYWVTPLYVTVGIMLSATILWAFVINPERTFSTGPSSTKQRSLDLD